MSKNRQLAKREIGNIPVLLYKHRIPKSFKCVQCGQTHKQGEKKFQHYFNTHCHRWE